MRKSEILYTRIKINATAYCMSHNRLKKQILLLNYLYLNYLLWSIQTLQVISGRFIQYILGPKPARWGSLILFMLLTWGIRFLNTWGLLQVSVYWNQSLKDSSLLWLFNKWDQEVLFSKIIQTFSFPLFLLSFTCSLLFVMPHFNVFLCSCKAHSNGFGAI